MRYPLIPTPSVYICSGLSRLFCLPCGSRCCWAETSVDLDAGCFINLWVVCGILRQGLKTDFEKLIEIKIKENKIRYYVRICNQYCLTGREKTTRHDIIQVLHNHQGSRSTALVPFIHMQTIHPESDAPDTLQTAMGNAKSE